MNTAWKHDFYRAFAAKGLIKSTYVNEEGEDMYFYDQEAMNQVDKLIEETIKINVTKKGSCEPFLYLPFWFPFFSF